MKLPETGGGPMQKSLKYTLAIAFAIICCMNTATAEKGDIFTGMARVIDSDMLEVDGQRIILFGVDAMDRNQTCYIDGKSWNCWAVSARELQILVANEPVSCEDQGIPDPFLRIYARCQVGDVDINEAFVRSGLALAFRRQSKDYVEAEKAAKAERIGLWQAEFIAPWKWRLMRGAPTAR